MLVTCNSCRYLKRANRTESVNSKFVEIDNGKGFGTLITDPIICQHEKCFVIITRRSPEAGVYEYKNRICGQAQLNKDNNCSYYESKRFLGLFN